MLEENFWTVLSQCGDFTIIENGMIRHKNTECCPITAVYHHVIPSRWLFNIEARLAAKELALPRELTDKIITAADFAYDSNPIRNKELQVTRSKLLTVLKLKERQHVRGKEIYENEAILHQS